MPGTGVAAGQLVTGIGLVTGLMCRCGYDGGIDVVGTAPCGGAAGDGGCTGIDACCGGALGVALRGEVVPL